MLISWMKREFNINVHKKNLENSFSNGYKIGIILNELDLLKDISKLKDDSSEDAINRNFDIINSKIENEKYILSDIEIKDIINSEKGVIASYLYSLQNYFNSMKVQVYTTQNTQNMFKKYNMKSTGVYSDNDINEYVESGSYPVEKKLRESERKFLEHRKKMEMDGYSKLMEIRENHAYMLQTHRQKRLKIEREAKEYIINYNKDGVRTWKQVQGKLVKKIINVE